MKSKSIAGPKEEAGATIPPLAPELSRSLGPEFPGGQKEKGGGGWTHVRPWGKPWLNRWPNLSEAGFNLLTGHPDLQEEGQPVPGQERPRTRAPSPTSEPGPHPPLQNRPPLPSSLP